MNLYESVMCRVTERYRHIWLNNRTGDLILSTDAYRMDYGKGKPKTIEVDVSSPSGGRHAKLKSFLKTHTYVCEGWKDRFE